MPLTPWTFKKGATDFTSKVLSANVTQGRKSYLDNYAGGSLVFTINNENNYASNFAFNDKIRIYAYSVDFGYDDIFSVQQIVFNDSPGDIDFCTATITCVDTLGRVGRYQAIDKSLTEVGTIDQMAQFLAGNGGPLPSNIGINTSLGSGSSTASAETYTGTVLNRINLLVATERGALRTGPQVAASDERIWPIPRDKIDSGTLDFTFGPTSSATQIAYQDFNRIQNGLEFINDATINPEGLASQNYKNQSSINSYGYGSYSASTVDYTVEQALGNAQWIANSFSEPSTLRFEVEFNDRAQDNDAYGLFIITFFSPTRVVNSLTYRLPGAVSDTTVMVASEGWSISITPEQTRYLIYFSPLDYYNFFTLNSADLGVLNSSRLGW